VKPKFSIITPTILRQTAHRTIASIDAQGFTDYEHLVAVDGPVGQVPNEWLRNPRRLVIRCSERHNDCGATCRNHAVHQARGEFILYLDDDDYYVPEALALVAERAKHTVGVFPILLGGQHWLRLPPGRGRTASCQLWHKRSHQGHVIAMPAHQKHYSDDSAWAGVLAERYSYQVVKDVPPLAVVEKGHNSSNLPGGPPMTTLPSLWDR
jgi:glycosyltransferase involved in cell wall biosynthesis